MPSLKQKPPAHAPELPGMSWSDGQHDGKLHLWGIHSDQATWGSTVDRRVMTDNVFSPCRHRCHEGVHLPRCHWSSEPFSRAMTSKALLGFLPEATVIFDPTYGCRLQLMPHCLQEVQ